MHLSRSQLHEMPVYYAALSIIHRTVTHIIVDPCYHYLEYTMIERTLRMTESNDTPLKRAGIPEAAGALIAGGATSFAGLGMAYEFVNQPAIAKAATALKEAEAKAMALYQDVAETSLTNSSPLARMKWVREQVDAAPEVAVLRKAYKSVPRPCTARDVFAHMSIKGKVTLGVAAVGAGLAAGYLIHKWRNRDTDRTTTTAPSSEQSQHHRTLLNKLDQKHAESRSL
jgi:hypothetical protein